MKPSEGITVKVGAYTTVLPLYRDRTTSEHIVAQVEACHRAIREKLDTDTVAEVLWVAYEFACKAYELEEAQELQDTELIRRFSNLEDKLRGAMAPQTPEPKGDSPQPTAAG